MASLRPLLELLDTERVLGLLGQRKILAAPEAVRPYLLAAMIDHLGAPLLAVTSRQEEAEHLARDIHAFLGRSGAEVFPGWEVLPGELMSPSIETMGRRLHVLARLQKGDPFVVVTTAQGATQLVAPPPGVMEMVRLAKGAVISLEEVAGRLVEMGYDRNYIVERRGEFAIRGGILDVFPPSAERPVRAELWG
ncbi:MAG: transcription-repair coupling factor, partial [Actinobacteria bacterium]|nr:transcription-repair coupling factor [Actinomycetota bacterium]